MCLCVSLFVCPVVTGVRLEPPKSWFITGERSSRSRVPEKAMMTCVTLFALAPAERVI